MFFYSTADKYRARRHETSLQDLFLPLTGILSLIFKSSAMLENVTNTFEGWQVKMGKMIEATGSSINQTPLDLDVIL